MAGKANSGLIGPRCKSRGFYSQAHYDQIYREKHPRVFTAEQLEERAGYHKGWYAQVQGTPEYIFKKRKEVLWRKYKLTPEQFDTMLAQQNNCCAICHRMFSATLPPCVDHDHATNAVRKLLCHPCNKGLGCFEDSLVRPSQATEYLAEHCGRLGRSICA